jgi:chromate transporter
MGLFFTTAALVTFGGAYAVLPFVAQQAVDTFGWLKPGQMVDGLALGETTPGPLIMVVAFVGFVGGWQATDMGWSGAILGCVIATYFTFLPSFLFILLGAPFIERMRGELHLTAALSGITAAVVGVVLNLALFFGKTVFLPELSSEGFSKSWSLDSIAASANYFAIVLAIVAFIALTRFKLNLAYLVAGCALVGLAKYLLAN